MFYCFCVLVGCLKSGRIYIHAEIEKINHEISKKKKKRKKRKKNTKFIYEIVSIHVYPVIKCECRFEY